MKPLVGRIVHYTNLGDKDGKYPPQVQAAIITAIYEDVEQQQQDIILKRVDDGIGTPDMKISDFVDLKIFYTSGFFDCPKIPKRTSPDQRGCWDWPVKA
jgi:hypothetical protein